MARFEDRFARQNLFGPPAPFPMPSPCSAIVRHLSGPNSDALAQNLPQASGPAGCAPKFHPVAFTAPRGLKPVDSHHCSTPWSVFQDGRVIPITPAYLAVVNRRWAHSTGRPPEGSRPLLQARGGCAGLGAAECAEADRPSYVWVPRLPLQQFHLLLTCFSA